MTKTQQFKLIDGTFNAAEAAQILLTLVRCKIDFHTREQASNEERFGRDVAHSERRLKELQQVQEAVTSLCDFAAVQHQHLEIQGWIQIAPVTPEDTGDSLGSAAGHTAAL
jgi:hypothetical protein